MKKILIVSSIIFSFLVLTGMSFNNYSPQVNAVYEELKSELQQKGVGVQQIIDSVKSIKDLLAQGLKKEEIKKFILDLFNKKIDPASFKSSLDSLSELMKNGEAFKQAKSFISKTLQDAQAQGLQGDQLKNKIREAVAQEEKKLEELKQGAIEKSLKVKEDAAKSLDDLQNKSLKDLFQGK